MAEIRVIARLVAAPGKIEGLRAAARAMLKPTHAEEGCKFYELYESTEGGRLLFNELWASQEAFERHVASPHFKQFDSVAKNLVAEPVELNFLKQLD